jgi:hypothetical protein
VRRKDFLNVLLKKRLSHKVSIRNVNNKQFMPGACYT